VGSPLTEIQLPPWTAVSCSQLKGPNHSLLHACGPIDTVHRSRVDPARNASLAAMQGSASGSNVRYYPT
jgi:hypothetical protein